MLPFLVVTAATAFATNKNPVSKADAPLAELLLQEMDASSVDTAPE
jgi:hypothetical protein